MIKKKKSTIRERRLLNCTSIKIVNICSLREWKVKQQTEKRYLQFYKELRTRIYNELQINKKMAVTKQMVGHSRVDNSKLQLEHITHIPCK